MHRTPGSHLGPRLAGRLAARLGRGRRGQSLVEFALILPLMLVFLAAVLDLGRVFYANITLTNAAREGAFEAARDPDSYSPGAPCDQVTNRVVCAVQFESEDSMVSIDKNDITMTCSLSGCPAQAGSTVAINVRGRFRLLTPLLATVFGGQELRLNSNAIAQIQYLPDSTVATPPPPPVADFDADPESGNRPLTVDFDDQSTGNPTGWQWDFGDGGSSTEQNPTHVYLAEGTYTVTLSVVNLTGADFETKTDYIVVGNPDPDSSPAPSPTPECIAVPYVIGMRPSDAAITIGNAGLNPVAQLLSNGQKNVVQAQNPDHTECRPENSDVVYAYRPQN